MCIAQVYDLLLLTFKSKSIVAIKGASYHINYLIPTQNAWTWQFAYHASVGHVHVFDTGYTWDTVAFVSQLFFYYKLSHSLDTRYAKKRKKKKREKNIYNFTFPFSIFSLPHASSISPMLCLFIFLNSLSLFVLKNLSLSFPLFFFQSCVAIYLF